MPPKYEEPNFRPAPQPDRPAPQRSTCSKRSTCKKKPQAFHTSSFTDTPRRLFQPRTHTLRHARTRTHARTEDGPSAHRASAHGSCAPIRMKASAQTLSSSDGDSRSHQSHRREIPGARTRRGWNRGAVLRAAGGRRVGLHARTRTHAGTRTHPRTDAPSAGCLGPCDLHHW